MKKCVLLVLLILALHGLSIITRAEEQNFTMLELHYNLPVSPESQNTIEVWGRVNNGNQAGYDVSILFESSFFDDPAKVHKFAVYVGIMNAGETMSFHGHYEPESEEVRLHGAKAMTSVKITGNNADSYWQTCGRCSGPPTASK
jgi:hypothetical protein